VRSLRVVPPGDGPEAGEPVTMAEALADLVTRVAAEGPVTLVLLYENAAGAIIVRPLPASLYVAKVLVAEAYDQLHPERESDA
jgi:hypothetical protein